MSLSLLAPLGLAALAALALPLLLHLVRRLELTTTEFAALRWIADRVRPRRRVRFERPWLLLLRLVLLALLALLLAQPVLIAPAAPMAPWIVVAPGVDRGAARAAATGVTADWRWLAPGFPSLDGAAPDADVPLASLLRELDTTLPDGATPIVIVPDELAGLDGERPRLAHAIDWRSVPGRMAATNAATAPEPIHLLVRHAPDAAPALRYLRAAVAAWNVDAPGCCDLEVQPLEAPLPATARWLVWLAPQTTPALDAWIERGGSAVLTHQADAGGDPLWRDASGHILARRVVQGRGHILALPGALAPTDLPLLLDADFPARLRAALRGPPPAPTRATAAAMQPGHAAITASTPTVYTAGAARALDPWLAGLIALLFLAERLLATRPRPDVSA